MRYHAGWIACLGATLALSAFGENVLTNPDFEDGLAGWYALGGSICPGGEPGNLDRQGLCDLSDQIILANYWLRGVGGTVTAPGRARERGLP